MFRLLSFALALFTTTLAVGRADDAADPLPKGALARFGSARLAGQSQFTLMPPEYTTVLTADVTGLRRYDLATGMPLDKIARTTTGGAVIISADGKRALGNHTGIQIVRDTATGAVVQKLQPPPGFSTVATSGSPPVSLSADGSILAQSGNSQGPEPKSEVIVWDVAKAEMLARITMPHRDVAIPVLSPDGKSVATWSYQYTPTAPGAKDLDPRRVVTVWDVASRTERFQMRLTGGGYLPVVAVFSPDGALLAAANGDGAVDVYDAKAGKHLRTHLGRSGLGVRLAFSPDGQTLAGIGADGTIQRWTADGRALGITEPPAQLPAPLIVLGIGFAEKDRVVAWATTGSVPVAWEAPSGKILSMHREHTAEVRGIGFADGGKTLVTAGLDNRVVRWDAANSKPLGSVAVRLAKVPNAAPPYRVPLVVSPDGTRVLSLGSLSTPAAAYDPATGSELFAFPRGPSAYPVNHAMPSHDLTRLVTLALTFESKFSARCTVWDLVEQKKVIDLTMPGVVSGITPTAALSPSGNRLVTVTSTRDAKNNQLRIVVTGWDLTTGRKLGEVEDPSASGTLHVAAANETSAVVSAGSRIWAVDFEAGKGGEEIEGLRAISQGAAGPIVFSPDGKRFATGVFVSPGVYGVRIYDWPRGTALHTFEGHGGPVTGLAFSPDGKTLATGSADTTTILWDLAAVPASRP